MPKGRTREVSKRAYRSYLKKATDFGRLASTALDSGNHDGAGLAAIHSVISSCDALSAFYLGIRSTAEGHEEVVEILRTVHLEGSQMKVG